MDIIVNEPSRHAGFDQEKIPQEILIAQCLQILLSSVCNKVMC
jgi:hypothetical protein